MNDDDDAGDKLEDMVRRKSARESDDDDGGMGVSDINNQHNLKGQSIAYLGDLNAPSGCVLTVSLNPSLHGWKVVGCIGVGRGRAFRCNDGCTAECLLGLLVLAAEECAT